MISDSRKSLLKAVDFAPTQTQTHKWTEIIKLIRWQVNGQSAPHQSEPNKELIRKFDATDAVQLLLLVLNTRFVYANVLFSQESEKICVYAVFWQQNCIATESSLLFFSNLFGNKQMPQTKTDIFTSIYLAIWAWKLYLLNYSFHLQHKCDVRLMHFVIRVGLLPLRSLSFSLCLSWILLLDLVATMCICRFVVTFEPHATEDTIIVIITICQSKNNLNKNKMVFWLVPQHQWLRWRLRSYFIHQ